MVVLLRNLGREGLHYNLRDQGDDEEECEGYKHEPEYSDNSKECLHIFTIRRVSSMLTRFVLECANTANPLLTSPRLGGGMMVDCGKIGTLFPHSVNGAGLRQQAKAHA